jgi:hypothetical protein
MPALPYSPGSKDEKRYTSCIPCTSRASQEHVSLPHVPFVGALFASWARSLPFLVEMKHPKIGPSAGNARSVPVYDDVLQRTDDRWQLIGREGEFNRQEASPTSALQHPRSSRLRISIPSCKVVRLRRVQVVVPAHVPSPSEVVHALFTQSLPDGRPEKPERDLNTTRKDSGTT